MHAFKSPNVPSNKQTVSVPLPSRKSSNDPIGLAHDAVNSSSRSLDPSTKLSMEKKFGHSFASVRVHDNPMANQSANMLGAKAYTLGNDIVFNKSMPGFTTKSDADLLTHELVHVLQSGEESASTSASRPMQVSKPMDEAEQEADRLSNSASDSSLPEPGQRVRQGTLMRSLQTTQRNFFDPNFCYKNSLRDSTHPDLTKVVAVMQAQIDTPNNCDGYVTLRTSVLRSGWGASVANFESLGGGTSQGVYEGIVRDDAAERVDYEERFSLDSCHAQFTRCHLITYTEGGTRYIFGKARYQPNVFATSTSGGTAFHDSTPPPALDVNPCDGLSATC
jgi:hypothetical protein